MDKQFNLFGQQVGDPAPDFEVDLLDGSKFKLSDHKGKVVFSVSKKTHVF